MSSEYESFSSNEDKEKGKGRQNNEKRRTLIFYQNLYGKFYKDDEYGYSIKHAYSFCRIILHPTLRKNSTLIKPFKRREKGKIHQHLD